MPHSRPESQLPGAISYSRCRPIAVAHRWQLPDGSTSSPPSSRRRSLKISSRSRVCRSVHRRARRRVGRCRRKRPERSPLIAVRAAQRLCAETPAAPGSFRTRARRPDRQGKPVDEPSDGPVRSSSPALGRPPSTRKTAIRASTVGSGRQTGTEEGVCTPYRPCQVRTGPVSRCTNWSRA